MHFFTFWIFFLVVALSLVALLPVILFSRSLLKFYPIVLSVYIWFTLALFSCLKEFLWLLLVFIFFCPMRVQRVCDSYKIRSFLLLLFCFFLSLSLTLCILLLHFIFHWKRPNDKELIPFVCLTSVSHGQWFCCLLFQKSSSNIMPYITYPNSSSLFKMHSKHHIGINASLSRSQFPTRQLLVDFV